MTIGIIGGGQLGRMMTQEAKKLGFDIVVLDPTPNCPAAQIGGKQIVGNFYDADKLRELVERSHVTTYDIEHINTEVLQGLVDEGNKIHSSPYVLKIIQDKLKQKDVLAEAGIPVPKYQQLKKNYPLHVERFGFPCIQKARKGGYDGRGVVVLKDKSDLEKAIKAESLLEEFVDFEKELAVIVARDTQGEVKCYPVVEMFFNERTNICDTVIAPARIEREIEEQAKRIAIKTIEAFDVVGILAVEMFLTKEGGILVNEVAPRPHNSGHYTLEACITSQFEQHIRAISGLPLGATDLLSPAVMINLLGAEGYKGYPIIEGLNKALAIPGLCFHFYGKETTSPFRKMGHVTILDEDLGSAIGRAKKAQKLLKVKAEVRI
jgi:5-(carboxyamino)imidazole ribonucleotide synthase